MNVRDVQWPIVVFETGLFPIIVASEAESDYIWEVLFHGDIMRAFDRHYRPLRFEITQREVFVFLQTETPDEAEFRSCARTAMKLRGPGTVRCRRRVQSVQIDTRGWPADKLWDHLVDSIAEAEPNHG